MLHRLISEFNPNLAPYRTLPNSGLKVPSVLRLSRLAVLDGALLLGYIGVISEERLRNVRQRLAKWVASES